MKYKLLLALIAITFFSACKKDASDTKVKDETTKESKKEKKEDQLFVLKNAQETNVFFTNTVVETYEENYLNYEFLYNGSGVGVGDINNDGLADIYFAGNSSDDKLFLNMGNMKFKDISVSSGIAELQGWSTGVNMVDVNADGYLDIYVCRSGPSKEIEKRTNRLYINNKDNTFTEAAADYGIAAISYSIQTAFFDYDLDGDLDMYLLNHPDPKFKAKEAIGHMQDIKAGRIQTDNFFENVNGKFVDRSKEANLVNFGYRHGIAVGDINKDGYPDLYISSDFEEPDVLCINQGNKTFKNEIDTYLRHISYNSMGNEMVDINNDGLLDVYVVDMAPDDHFRSKAYMASMDVVKFHTLKDNGYHNQYMFNTLHLNNGNNSFSEVAQLSGVAKTDWSWAPLFFDMDHDGYKDLFITNGIKENFLFRDIQVMVEQKQKQMGRNISLEELLKIVPSDITKNNFYHNKNGIKFEDVSDSWSKPSLYNSNGVATADFDNDGDLDFVTNNMDSNASIYESKAMDIKKGNGITLSLKGSQNNPFAIGAKVKVQNADATQWHELHNARGYLSSVDYPIFFGLGDAASANVEIIWPDGKSTVLNDLQANKKHIIDYNTAEKGNVQQSNDEKTLLTEIASNTLGINFKHKEDKFDDYKKQILLPHSQSNVGPFVSKADVNGDGLEDFFVGGAAGQTGALFLQQQNGKFVEKEGPWKADKRYDDLGSLFFDKDGDGDLDLYVTSGGAHTLDGDGKFYDRLYQNDGNGLFVKSSVDIPYLGQSNKVVVTADVDKDGDQDLFVGGRIIPDQYPYAPKSYLLINENGKFKEKEIQGAGMVAGALFSDYDNDGDEDLITAGEWSPIQIFENTNGNFSPVEADGLKDTVGLWFSLAQRDIDDDGDLDYFAGNLGLNTKFKVNDKKEFHIYCNDFDQNGTYDVVLSSTYNNQLVPVRGRECSSEQMPFIKDKFKDYRSFAGASLIDIYGDKDLDGALHYQANMLHSVFIENKGNGSFEVKKLPIEFQFSPIQSFAFKDIDGDGKDEVFAAGNLFNVEVETVRYDASVGNVMSLKDGVLRTLDPHKTGFATKGDARDINFIKQGEQTLLMVTNNNGGIDVFKM